MSSGSHDIGAPESCCLTSDACQIEVMKLDLQRATV
jgi:hypothetical protein